MKKRNEKLAYVGGNKSTLIAIKLEYLERRNLKYKIRDLFNTKFEGFKANLAWKSVSNSWIELYKSAIDIILEANIEIEMYHINGINDAVQVAQKVGETVDRVYTSELAYTNKDKSLYFVRLNESLIGQFCTLISGIYGYLDLMIDGPDSGSSKAELTKYALDKGLLEKVNVKEI